MVPRQRDAEGWAISLYFGFGLGAAQGNLTTIAAPARAPSAPRSQLLDIKDTRLAWQVAGGLPVPVTSRLAFTAQYRWLDAGIFYGVDSRGQGSGNAIRLAGGSITGNVAIGAGATLEKTGGTLAESITVRQMDDATASTVTTSKISSANLATVPALRAGEGRS